MPLERPAAGVADEKSVQKVNTRNNLYAKEDNDNNDDDDDDSSGEGFPIEHPISLLK